jgi:hypothetical protein
MSSTKPPKNKKELLQRLIDIVRHGEYDMPIQKFKGTGAPGVFLEDLLGLTTGNKDIPDSIGWELKYYNDATNLITLFHNEPQPPGVMRQMVTKFGWKDKNDRLSFRHTIAGKSDRFKVGIDAGHIIVKPLKDLDPIPYWTPDGILSAVGGKLRRLALVKGVRHGQKIKYVQIDCFENILLSEFINELLCGTIKIDFDVREAKAGSVGLRNHGTKFRICPDDVCRIYAKKERIC